ncbi:MAG: peptidoglycan D,D-transpeptidase FtsI family protein [Gammaproteobacteria bacterium]
MNAGHESVDFGRRRWVLLGLFALAACGLAWRALTLQLTHHDFLKGQGDDRSVRVVELAAHRGTITDRNGEALAVSTPVSSVWAAPRRLLQQRNRWAELGEVIGLSREHLRSLIEPRVSREFVYLRRHVSPELADAVARLGIEGVGLVKESRRYYPAGEVTAHLLGFTNVDDVGQEGVELAFDKPLSGIDGAKRVIKDRLGRIVENIEIIRAPQDGTSIALSIDKRVQYVAYREVKAAVMANRARAASAVIVDARTGEILAIVNQPSFNPNNRGALKGEFYRNRAMTDVYEPGSVMKPFTIAAALDAGTIEPGTRVDTGPGQFTIGSHTVHDIHNYGTLDITGIIEKSSNIGATKIALGLDSEVLWRAFHGAGFGTTSGTGFPGESPGFLPDYNRWREIEHATISFGYGLSTTTAQLAQAYTVFANRGRLVPASLLRRDGAADGERVFSEHTAETMRAMLQTVVESGTGKLAAVPGYHVAGKTGTVHKIEGDGYAPDRYLSVFAGLVPATNPRLVGVVMIDEPQGGEYYGGRVAAPVFAAIMRDALRLLNIPPDDPPTVLAAAMALHEGAAAAQAH